MSPKKQKCKYLFHFHQVKVTQNCDQGQILIKRGDKVHKANIIKNLTENEEVNIK